MEFGSRDFLGNFPKAYCYAFNGKEQDPEWGGNGNMYDYGFRIYNPRIAKFLSMDPLFMSFPWWTPYQYAGNTPIQAVDMDGLEAKTVIRYWEFHANGDPYIDKTEVREHYLNVSTTNANGQRVARTTTLDIFPEGQFFFSELDEPIDENGLTDDGLLPSAYYNYTETSWSKLSDDFKAEGDWSAISARDRNAPDNTMNLGDYSAGTDVLMARVDISTALKLKLPKTKSVETPYGDAIQSTTDAAVRARQEVLAGAKLYRIGTTGKSAAAEAQFWALENPLADPKGFAKKYGIPVENIQNADFIEIATVKPGSDFVTRVAPNAPGGPVGGGGGIEVVTPSGGVDMESFHTID